MAIIYFGRKEIYHMLYIYRYTYHAHHGKSLLELSLIRVAGRKRSLQEIKVGHSIEAHAQISGI